MLSDPVLQSSIVGAFLGVIASAVTSYLWRQFRSERYLLYWSVAWAFSSLRWTVHYLAASGNATLGAIEGILLPCVLIFQVLGSFELLPRKPWNTGTMSVATVTLFLVSALVAIVRDVVVEAGYALFVGVIAFCGYCLWRAYRLSRLSGYLVGVAASVWQTAVVAATLLWLGAAVSDQLIIPLVYNTSMMLSLVLIAFQRRGRQLAESEHTLQKIFDTAPTPIIIVRPPAGEIERANPIAIEMLGIAADRINGKSALDQGIVSDSEVRRAIYGELQSGRRVEGQEMPIMRGGHDARMVSVNADRIELDGGPRYIFSFYDLTDLRRAEEELRTSAEEMRLLYVRLANVEDDERRALHAELHDQIGANLAALRLELDVVTSLFERNEDRDAKRRLATLREIATETAAMARDLMAELRPPALDDFGLTAALRDFAESRSSRLNLPIHVTGEDLVPRPSHLVEGALFRIAYEAVINAARHASASRVAIHVEELNGIVVLTVEDDGAGFDLDAPVTETGHWGLKNMRERARAVGGLLSVETEPGKGTRIKARAPRKAR